MVDVYGMGQPLMDILVDVDDTELDELRLNKGIMHLIDDERRDNIMNYIDKKGKRMICGGDVPNTLIALSALKIKTAFSGKVGSDDFGKEYVKQLSNNGVLQKITEMDGPTGTSVIMISPDTERTMNTHLGVSELFTTADVDRELIKHAKYLYITGYQWNNDSQKKAILKAIDIAKENGTKVIFDVADPFVVNINHSDFLSLIKDHIDVVFANKEEAMILFDTGDPKKSINDLSKLVDISVVKIGSEGALVKEKGKDSILIPPNKVHAVDTTGAGDMFAAGLIYGLCKDMAIDKAAVFASYLASQIVRQVGAQFSRENRERVLHAVEKDLWNYIPV